ncbi:MAG: hypothetical protein KDC71_24075 [Acidobacteria bacterium]|nr:hypothetical protein [Acidobacteriota bacterium]
MEKKQQMQVEIMDRFNVLNSRWERDLGEVLLSMREFQDAVKESDIANKKHQSEWIASQKKAFDASIRRHEDAALRLEQMYRAVTLRFFVERIFAMILALPIGFGLGWVLQLVVSSYWV